MLSDVAVASRAAAGLLGTNENGANGSDWATPSGAEGEPAFVPPVWTPPCPPLPGEGWEGSAAADARPGTAVPGRASAEESPVASALGPVSRPCPSPAASGEPAPALPAAPGEPLSPAEPAPPRPSEASPLVGAAGAPGGSSMTRNKLSALSPVSNSCPSNWSDPTLPSPGRGGLGEVVWPAWSDPTLPSPGRGGLGEVVSVSSLKTVSVGQVSNLPPDIRQVGNLPHGSPVTSPVVAWFRRAVSLASSRASAATASGSEFGVGTASASPDRLLGRSRCSRHSSRKGGVTVRQRSTAATSRPPNEGVQRR